jgi:hypothetical protein
MNNLYKHFIKLGWVPVHYNNHTFEFFYEEDDVYVRYNTKTCRIYIHIGNEFDEHSTCIDLFSGRLVTNRKKAELNRLLKQLNIC